MNTVILISETTCNTMSHSEPFQIKSMAGLRITKYLNAIRLQRYQPARLMDCFDIHTCMSVSLTGSRGSNVVAALRLSSLWEMWKMSKPLDPRRIDLRKRQSKSGKNEGDRRTNTD